MPWDGVPEEAKQGKKMFKVESSNIDAGDRHVVGLIVRYKRPAYAFIEYNAGDDVICTIRTNDADNLRRFGEDMIQAADKLVAAYAFDARAKEADVAREKYLKESASPAADTSAPEFFKGTHGKKKSKKIERPGTETPKEEKSRGRKFEVTESKGSVVIPVSDKPKKESKMHKKLKERGLVE
jgi:hypothetical protein